MKFEMIRDGRQFLTLGLAFSSLLIVTSVRAAVTISSAATQNMSCDSGVCSPTASKATLNVDDLKNLLQAGSITVTTTGSGGIQANDVVSKGVVSWTSNSTLSFDAYRTITIEQLIAVEGQGGLSFATDDGGKGGTLSFGKNGRVTLSNLTSQVVINKSSYTLVDTLPHLAGAISSNPDGNFVLTNSYDASQDGTYSASPIATALSGNFQGFGNAISNVSIDYTSTHGKPPIGLFETVSATGSIANLRLDKIKYAVSYRKRGGIGGLVENNFGNLSGDEVTGSIKAWVGSGGLVGINESSGQVISSSTDVRISVKGNGVAGGLAATNFGTITLSHASGSVSGDIMAGGLVANNGGPITQSFATGAVAGLTGGGLVGGNGVNGTVADSYSTGSTTSAANNGGFVGDDSHSPSPISTSYSIGGVITPYDGGFACTATVSNLSNDYWDTDTSGTTYPLCNDTNVSSGITGLSTQQFQSGLPSGFSSKIWAEDTNVNGGLPYLINNPPAK